ncbi:amidohydrolase family protein, partial [Escherichia coli]|uniref:amidohydrolase family protein n=1 Tax=Escherichia coli TaxID=562 RepID=UPI00227E44CC
KGEEQGARARALALLEFVGLESMANEEARNLPYGKQRLLEIARALALDDKIGNFNVGKEADFVVLDPAVTPLQQLRHANSATLMEQGFMLMTLGDDRNIYCTYVDGKVVYQAAR